MYFGYRVYGAQSPQHLLLNVVVDDHVADFAQELSQWCQRIGGGGQVLRGLKTKHSVLFLPEKLVHGQTARAINRLGPNN